MKTIIAVPDFTRNAHLKNILPPLLKKLKRQGICERDIEIIIATGLHKAPTKREINVHIGNIMDKIKISTHNYRAKYVSYFGKTKNNIPIYLNKKLKGVDSIITIAVVEPHLYAGYSGGAKVVAIGLAGEKTINITHHPHFLDHPDTRICSVSDNPFRNFIHEVAVMLPISYSINIINDQKGKLLKIYKGSCTSSFNKAVKYCRRIYEKKINKNLDVIICDIPEEKAQNLYQASRAFNYVANTIRPVLKDNALILVKANLKDGFGKGLVERRFIKKIREIKEPTQLIEDIKKRGCLAGEHRAYMVAKAMQKAMLGFISRRAGIFKNKNLPFLFFNDLKEARKFIKRRFKDQPQVYNLENAFTIILTHK